MTTWDDLPTTGHSIIREDAPEHYDPGTTDLRVLGSQLGLRTLPELDIPMPELPALSVDSGGRLHIEPTVNPSELMESAHELQAAWDQHGGDAGDGDARAQNAVLQAWEALHRQTHIVFDNRHDAVAHLLTLAAAIEREWPE